MGTLFILVTNMFVAYFYTDALTIEPRALAHTSDVLCCDRRRYEPGQRAIVRYLPGQRSIKEKQIEKDEARDRKRERDQERTEKTVKKKRKRKRERGIEGYIE